MSSLKSLEPEAAADALEQAVVDVAEQSFCGFAERCTPALFAELLERTGDEASVWLRATLGFAGPFGGTLMVELPEALAGELLSACLGMDPDPEDPSLPGVTDAVGEFTNMVCGAWLTRSHGEEKFDLQPPRLERHDEPGRKRWTLEPSPTLLMSVNDRPVRLRLTL